MAARVGVIACGIHRRERIGLQTLRTTDEILAVDDIVAVLYHGFHRRHRLVDIFKRDQRCERILAGGAQSGRLAPEVGVIIACIIECGIGIHPSRDPVVEPQIHIAANVQPRGVIVLSLSKLHQVVHIVETYVGIEVRKTASALKLGDALITLKTLLHIVGREEVNVRIAIGIHT